MAATAASIHLTWHSPRLLSSVCTMWRARRSAVMFECQLVPAQPRSHIETLPSAYLPEIVASLADLARMLAGCVVKHWPSSAKVAQIGVSSGTNVTVRPHVWPKFGQFLFRFRPIVPGAIRPRLRPRRPDSARLRKSIDLDLFSETKLGQGTRHPGGSEQ